MKWAADDFFEFWRGCATSEEEENKSLSEYLDHWLGEVPGSIIRIGGDHRTYLLMILYVVDELIRNPRALDFTSEIDGETRTIRRNVTGFFSVFETPEGGRFHSTDTWDEATFRVTVYGRELNHIGRRT